MMTQTSQRDLKAQLVSFARQIGFDSCRIAACTEPAHASEFRQWLRDGAHGEMHYMQRGEEKRCDPQKILPGARSIVVLALNYFQGNAAHRDAATAKTGRIARYAWDEDYHDVIEAKLSELGISPADFHDWVMRRIYQADEHDRRITRVRMLQNNVVLEF